MLRIAGLTLAVLGAFLVGCSKDEDHHDGMDHGAMNSMGSAGMPDMGKAGALPAGANKVCPVTGEVVAADIFAEYKGKKVYFCCDDCVADFKKSPDGYMAKAYPDMGK